MFADFCEKVLEEREKGRGKDTRKKAKRAKSISFILLSRCPKKQTNNPSNNSVSRVYMCNVEVIIVLYFDWFSS
jgi:hypothetical protein